MSSRFTIEGHAIGEDAPCFVIAEIGINHGGSEEIAEKMIRAAAASGADSVKFQTVDADASYMPGTASWKEFIGKGLSLAAQTRLNHLARQLGMVPFSTPGDEASLDLMLASGMRAAKVSSGLMTNLPMLRAIGASGLPVILSTGMADMDEVQRSVDALHKAGTAEIAVLQCASLYPSPPEVVNLRAMATMREALKLPVGYSDHCLGNLACLAAVAAGAKLIEKHFSLNKQTPGADHHLSSEPAEFAEMMRGIREIETMLGTGEKAPTEEERRLRPGRERMLVLREALPAGTALESTHFIAMRVPAEQAGLPASALDRVTGRRLARAMAKKSILRSEDLEPQP